MELVLSSPPFLPPSARDGGSAMMGRRVGGRGSSLEQLAVAEASAQPQSPLLCARGPSLAYLLPLPKQRRLGCAPRSPLK